MKTTEEALADRLEVAIADWHSRLQDGAPTRPLADELAAVVLAQPVPQPNRDVIEAAIAKAWRDTAFAAPSDSEVADAILAALPIPATGEVGTIEKLKVAATLPHPGGTSSAAFMRGAARKLEDGYEVGGSGVTAAVVRVLRVVADAVEVTP